MSLSLELVQSALRNNGLYISSHAKRRKSERDIPLYSILHALPKSNVDTRVIQDKHDPKATRLNVNIVLHKKMYTLVFGDLKRKITLITEFEDRLHQSYADDHYSLGDLIRKAG